MGVGKTCEDKVEIGKLLHEDKINLNAMLYAVNFKGYL